MNVLVTASARFVVTPDGELWSPNSSFGYRFWTRYLDVFDEVRVLVRAKRESEPPPGWIRASGCKVVAAPLPFYQGPAGFIRALPKLRAAIGSAIVKADAIQLRLPCALGELARRALAMGRPYAVEVVGDPGAVFAPGALEHPLRPFFRKVFVHVLERACTGACAVAYVSDLHLPARYPCAASAFRTVYSSIELPRETIRTALKYPPMPGKRISLVTVGTLEQLYKAPDVLIDAVGMCVRDGVDIELRIVGDGKYRAVLEDRARERGLQGRATFVGQLPDAEAVRRELDRSDAFVLPSRTEGLPKAMIEAMARGLPCIGSTVGGIPELLGSEDMIPPNDPEALSAKIREVVADPLRMQRMSRQNILRAQDYCSDVLRPRRIALYQRLKSRTSAWLSASASQRT